MIVSWHRKYRPKRVEDLDQEKVRTYFTSLLKSGKFTQSYLFTGPKGTGKTTAARLLALILNCESNATAIAQGKALKDPCGKCDVCTSILEGGSSCVFEMDAASNRGIDDIRQLRERINLMPSQGSFSVYIIDEVHMLTTEAFNALLKTLEEPPQHVVLCLCTTEEHKLPATIVSRCTRIEYGLSTDEEIIRSLKRVVTGEKLTAEDTALGYIATAGGGSFRDAVKYLEQLALSTDNITLEKVEQLLSTASGQSAESLLNLLQQGEIKKALALVAQLEASGGKVDDLGKKIVQLALSSIRKSVNQGNQVNQEQLQLIEIFSKAFARFNQVPIATLPLEMAIVEYGLYLGSLKTSVPSKPAPVTAAPVSSPVKPQSVATSKPSIKSVPKATSKTPPEEPEPETKPQVSETPATTAPATSSSMQLTSEILNKHWNQFLKKVELQNHAIATVLRGANILSCQGNCVEIEVGYSFHKRQLEQDRYIRFIDTAATEIFGDRILLSVKLGKPERIPKKLQGHDNVSPSVKAEDEALISAVEEVFGV